MSWCIIIITIRITTIYPFIQFLLHINVHYNIIPTLEVHQLVGQCYLIILCDINTIGCLIEDGFVLVTISCAGFAHNDILLLCM